MKKLGYGISAFILFLLFNNVFAENKGNVIVVGPGLGWMFYANSAQLENGPNYNLTLGYNFTKELGLEFNAGYLKPERKIPFHHTTTGYNLSLNMLYNFVNETNFTPYVLFGGSALSLDDGTGLNHKRRSGVWSVGAGIKYFVSEYIALRADVKNISTVRGNNKTHFMINLGAILQVGFDKPKTSKRPNTLSSNRLEIPQDFRVIG